MKLKTYLIITGIGTATTLSMPAIVQFGQAWILPGIILEMMPTAFLYGIAFALLRAMFCKVCPPKPSKVLAIAATGIIAVTLPVYYNLSKSEEFTALENPDLDPPSRIKFNGNVLITRTKDLTCDGMCVALLKTPRVNAVRVLVGNKNISYKIVSNEARRDRVDPSGYGLDPRKTQSNIYVFPNPTYEKQKHDWEYMVSKGKSLIETEDAFDPDFVINIGDDPLTKASAAWSLMPKAPHKQEFSITDSRGAMLLRRVFVSRAGPQFPLIIGGFSEADQHYGWSHVIYGQNPRDLTGMAHQWLREHTNLDDDHHVVEDVQANMRQSLVSTLDDKDLMSGDPEFQAVDNWVRLDRKIGVFLDASDQNLLVRAISDPRVNPEAGPQISVAAGSRFKRANRPPPSYQTSKWAAIFEHVAAPAIDVRRAVALRFLSSETTSEAKEWDRLLSGLPEGSFKHLLPEEHKILVHPVAVSWAPVLISRQRERGAAAASDLVHILEVLSSQRYGHTVDGDYAMMLAKRTLIKIGPQAAVVLPRVEQWLNSSEMIHKYRNNKADWDVLLLALGRSESTLTNPQWLNGDVAYRRHVVQNLKVERLRT